MRDHGPEDEKQFIATTYIDLTRHGNRYGGPMKIELFDGTTIDVDDGKDLTPRGKTAANEFGAGAYPEEVTLVHPRGGDEARHGETGEELLTGSGRFGVARDTAASVRDAEGRVKGARRGAGVDYQTSGVMPSLKEFTQLIADRLQERVSALPHDEQQRIKDDAELRARYREEAQVDGLRAALSEKNDMVQLLAENTAAELMHIVELSRRGIKGGETKAIPVVGSGLFAESLYKHALVVEDENTGERKIGFDNVDEIGGFTTQATAVRLKLQRDDRMGDACQLEDFDKDTRVEIEFTDPERAKIFEGKKVSLDWDKVQELAAAAKERFNETKDGI